MEYLLLGFFTGLSLILAIGPQNIFVIEQGLKRNYIFIITTICAFSDVLLIFIGVFVYQFFSFISWEVEILLNVILVLFLLKFIWDKFKELNKIFYIENFKESQNLKSIILKTLGFTYLNPHVYSDTVFILGNFSKNFLLNEKIIFGIGASIASFLFFFLLGYLSKVLSRYAKSKKVWNIINLFIIIFMSFLTLLVFLETIN